MNRWWEDDPRERYWLEITDRPDVGNDLKAPQRGRDGKEVWHYSLIRAVREGDVVFHYEKPASGEGAICSWSSAVGSVWEESIVWAPHGGGNAAVESLEDGWKLGLAGRNPIEPPVPLSAFREVEEIVRMVDADIRSRTKGTTYLPFENGKRAIRPKQAYLCKFPADLVDWFPQLGVGDSPRLSDLGRQSLGQAYVRAAEDVLLDESEPFARDPAIVERGLRSHAVVQNLLAERVRTAGYEPISPAASDPNFDLAWTDGERWFVVEVKSLTQSNFEKQLRLGLGQVLRYRQRMAVLANEAVGVLACEWEPPLDWVELCASVGIVVTWPPHFDALVLPVSAAP